jgi:triosephosphate isomerase (TIM)
MIIAGNFKANHTFATCEAYLAEFASYIDESNADDIYIFPPFTALQAPLDKRIRIGAQNGYPAEKGSYTGEICLEQLSALGIDTILIGHSERRHIIKETQEFIARKFEFFKRNNFTIFYCVGEPIEVRQKGLESVLRYIDDQLENIDLEYPNLIVAYEPVWAIGTGISASLDDIEETHKALREKIAAPLLYGGSVNAANAEGIFASPFVDGVLVGNFSLKADEFSKLLKLSTVRG